MTEEWSGAIALVAVMVLSLSPIVLMFALRFDPPKHCQSRRAAVTLAAGERLKSTVRDLPGKAVAAGKTKAGVQTTCSGCWPVV